MTTKHEQILNYIRDLPIDTKISVRRIARDLKVSDGTAYRAIKEAENQNLVRTVERVGTVRIEPYDYDQTKRLTIREIVRLTDCTVHGGDKGLDGEITKFIIGAMQEEAVMTYLRPEALMIVGDREDIQRVALEHGMAVLITGGFQPSQANIDLANQKQIPIMSVAFDTYSTATVINKAMIERAIQQDIVLVEDIFIPFEKTFYLFTDSHVEDYRKLNEKTSHSRFPVVNKDHELQGIVTAKDLLGRENQEVIESCMTGDPLVAKLSMSVVSVTHMMVWDGLELLPVVDDSNRLLGIVSRQDVLRTLEYKQHQVNRNSRLESMLEEKLECLDNSLENPRYRMLSDATMSNQLGTLSTGLLLGVIQLVVEQYFADVVQKTAIIESVNFLNLRLVQLNSTLEIHPRILTLGRRHAYVEVHVYHGQQLMAKATLTMQIPLDMKE